MVVTLRWRGHGLQHRQAEALVAAGVGEHVGAAEQGGLVGLGDIAGDEDPVGDPAGGHGRGQLPAPGQAGQDQAVGQV